LYHIAYPAKYRRAVTNAGIEDTIKGTCNGTAERFEIIFFQTGIEGGRVHFLAQPVPPYSPAKIVTAIKRNISGQVFEKASGREEAAAGRRVLEQRIFY
jgi:REP element-mobilizing transposase RayT